KLHTLEDEGLGESRRDVDAHVDGRPLHVDRLHKAAELAEALPVERDHIGQLTAEPPDRQGLFVVAGGNDQLNFDIRICLFKRFDQSPLDRKLQLIAPRRVGDRRLRADARGQDEAQHDAQYDNLHRPHGVTVPPLEESDLRDDARTTSLLLTSITRETTSSLASRLSASTASRPIATGSCRTVVSGGLRCRAIARSSYPATATSAGTLS